MSTDPIDDFITPPDVDGPLARTAAERAAEEWAEQVHQLDRDGYTADDVRQNARAAFLAGVRWRDENPVWVTDTRPVEDEVVLVSSGGDVFELTYKNGSFWDNDGMDYFSNEFPFENADGWMPKPRAAKAKEAKS